MGDLISTMRALRQIKQELSEFGLCVDCRYWDELRDIPSVDIRPYSTTLVERWIAEGLRKGERHRVAGEQHAADGHFLQHHAASVEFH